MSFYAISSKDLVQFNCQVSTWSSLVTLVPDSLSLFVCACFNVRPRQTDRMTGPVEHEYKHEHVSMNSDRHTKHTQSGSQLSEYSRERCLVLFDQRMQKLAEICFFGRRGFEDFWTCLQKCREVLQKSWGFLKIWELLFNNHGGFFRGLTESTSVKETLTSRTIGGTRLKMHVWMACSIFCCLHLKSECFFWSLVYMC